MQQNTELLVVTIAQMSAEKETQARSRIHIIIETIRSAPGLVTAHFYRGQENIYFLLTTWEDEYSWQQAQERHSPFQLLSKNSDVLAQQPRQWILSYSWGYRRPIASPELASAHLVILPTRNLQQVQERWLQELHQTELQTSLAFGFLAQGDIEAATEHSDTQKIPDDTEKQSARESILLAFYSWSSETERNDFKQNDHYQQIKTLEEQASSTLILSLERL